MLRTIVSQMIEWETLLMRWTKVTDSYIITISNPTWKPPFSSSITCSTLTFSPCCICCIWVQLWCHKFISCHLGCYLSPLLMVHLKTIITGPQQKAQRLILIHPHLISLCEFLVRHFYHNLGKDAPTYISQTAERGLLLVDEMRAPNDRPTIGDAPGRMPANCCPTHRQNDFLCCPLLAHPRLWSARTWCWCTWASSWSLLPIFCGDNTHPCKGNYRYHTKPWIFLKSALLCSLWPSSITLCQFWQAVSYWWWAA